ncbi:MMPL family transporter [Actinocrinis puniceicyclus]|uniref:MMPL family transporter n=1 Tax=Actinocrinis puniceicyclus TaxID=977794 RepID=A0A8J7WR84_9ACTN|nr:MMPL family transporter [Actinocrinis puniceicyclus]MBS2966033.1 MMPL family transporter [Actinocrinis puniceicyclus]
MNALQRAGNALARVPGGRVGKWVVLGVWLVLLVGFGSMSGKLTGAENNQPSSWLPGSAESTQVVKLTGQFQSTGLAPAVVVYERDGGITPSDVHKAQQDAIAFAEVPHTTGKIVGPIPSKDGKAIETIVQIDLGAKNDWNLLKPAVDAIKARAASGAAGLTTYVTGPAGFGATEASAFSGIDGVLLYATIAVIVVLLLLTYRSPTLWLLPLVSSGLALAVTMGLVYLLAAHAGLTVNGQSQGILLVLVMGAGTDYALLLVARYREELRRHEDRHEAMAVALHRAGPAIIASAATVGIGMLCLTAAEMNSTNSLGPVCAIGVIVALLAMVTLLPALLTILGRWVFWPVRPAAGSEDPTTNGVWARIGGGIAKRQRTVWIGTVVILGALAFGISGLKADGLSNAGTFTNTPDAIVGQQVADAHFPAGAGSPIVVIANDSYTPQVENAVASTPGIASVDDPVSKNGYVYMQGNLTSAPDSQAAKDVVNAVRANVRAIQGADAKVGGNTAVVMDIEAASQHDDKTIIPLILLVVLVILGLLLRALVAPLVLIATVVLSFGASLGLSVLFFNHVFHFSGEDAAYPLLSFVFLVALGIDYNIFLMTRIREEAVKAGTRRGALTGLAATGGVITSAGLILAGTFGVLATLPITAFAEIGFTVSLGVLLDTFIVRSILVTALAMDLDHRIWWPSRLGRRATAFAAAVPAAKPAADEETAITR